MKQGIDALRGLKDKLRMMLISISGPSYIYGDNIMVVHNAYRPESVLRKKRNSVGYNTVQESVAMGESLIEHAPSRENVAGLMTKVLYGQRRKYLVSNDLYYS